jgi:hypothetical protein
MTLSISNSSHKALLYRLFFTETMMGVRPVQFPIDQLVTASAAAKKLREGAKQDGDMIEFQDNPVDFTPDEWVLLKDLFKKKTTGDIKEAEAIQELQVIFETLPTQE